MITRRDHFAMAALTGLIGGKNYYQWDVLRDSAAAMAETAFTIADAMEKVAGPVTDREEARHE